MLGGSDEQCVSPRFIVGSVLQRTSLTLCNFAAIQLNVTGLCQNSDRIHLNWTGFVFFTVHCDFVFFVFSKSKETIVYNFDVSKSINNKEGSG